MSKGLTIRDLSCDGDRGMARAAFRQADIERIFRAARNTSSIVQIDLRNLVVTVLPRPEPSTEQLDLAQDGKENWDDD